MKTFKNGRKPQKSEKWHFLLHNVLTSTNQDSACIYLLGVFSKNVVCYQFCNFFCQGYAPISVI